MEPSFGGPCQGIRNLVPYFEDYSKHVEVVCLDDPKSDYLSKETIQIHALGKSFKPWGYHPALRPWLKRNLPRFDVVILNGLWQYPGYVLSQIAGRPNTPPYFVFPHGTLSAWFQRAPERRLKAIRNWFYWKLIEQKVVHRAEALLFTSEGEKRMARDTFRPYRPKREITVGYGVPPPPQYHPRMEEALRQKCPGLDGRPYLLFLGRIYPIKGIDLLIRAYAANYHSPRATRHAPLPTLIIAGPGLDSPYGRKMQQLAADLCPPSSVLWPGMLNGDAKWGAIYSAETFVLTSHHESFGIAVVESLACGIPVLISNQVSICCEIESDKAGLVADDTPAGAEQLLRCWEGLSLADKTAMKLAAVASYKKRFSMCEVATKVIHVIHILSDGRDKFMPVS